MKKIAIALAVVLGVATVSIATSEAAFNGAKYKACWKRNAGSANSPGFLFLVDKCYYGW